MTDEPVSLTSPPDAGFVQEVLAQLPWYHQLALLDKPPGPETRRWYAAKTPVKTLVKKRVKTPEHILLLLAENPTLTLADVAGAIGKSVSAVERASAKLAKDGRLNYVGAQKGGHWEVLDHG